MTQSCGSCAAATGSEPLPVTSTFATTTHRLPGIGLFAVTAGAGPLVVCLHGITANAYVWLPVMERLARTFRVVAVDQRGHGRSDRPAGAVYGAQDFAHDAIALIEALGEHKAILVGHSLGARNALTAAVGSPRHVAAVVAIDYVPFIEVATLDALARRVAGGDRRFASQGEVEVYLRERYPRLPDDAIERRARHGYRRDPDGTWRPLADPAAMAETCRGLRADLAPTLAMVAVPTLLLRGAHSSFVSREAFQRARELRPDLPAHEIDGADHYVPEERPAEIAGAVADLSASIEPRRLGEKVTIERGVSGNA